MPVLPAKPAPQTEAQKTLARQARIRHLMEQIRKLSRDLHRLSLEELKASEERKDGQG